jgi:hypothetical protein
MLRPDGYAARRRHPDLNRGWRFCRQGQALYHNLFDANYIATRSVLNVAGSNARALFPGAARFVYTGVRSSF